MNNNIKKNFIWNTIGSFTNAMTSLVFLIIVTRINGVDDAGIFTFAFSTACLLYILGLYSGRTYQVTENNEKIFDSDYINTRLFTSSLMIILVIIFSVIKGYSLFKIIVMVLLVIGRILSGAHWCSDIIGGILISAALLMSYYTFLNYEQKK